MISRSQRLRSAIRMITVVYGVSLFVLTHVPLPEGAVVGHSDKAAHFLAYLVLTLLVSASLAPEWPRLRFKVGIGLLSYGALDEALQAIPVIQRNADVWDWVADGLGVGVGMVLVEWWYRRIHQESVNDRS